MERCNGCCKEFDKSDLSYTAYLQDRSKVEGLCKHCKYALEQADLDKVVGECLEKLCHVVNGGSAHDLAASLHREIYRQHRYLQNELFTALHFFFELYGNLPESQFDARNAWAVQAAKRWQQVSFNNP